MMPQAASRPVRVGLLTYGLDRPLSGVTRVALELGRVLHQRDDCEVVFLTTYRHGPFRDDSGFQSWYLPGCRLLPGLMALGGPLIALAAQRLRLDVVHDPIGISPFTLGHWAGRFRRLTTIHDAIAFRYPEGYPWLNNFLHQQYVPATLANLDGVVADSTDGARDLGAFLKLAPERVHVVPLGVSAHFQPIPPDGAAAVAERYGLTGPYILSVGAQKAHKNVARLVAAFAQVRAEFPEVRLAIAGPAQWQHSGVEDEIARLGIGSAVARLGYVAEEDLPALYSAARLFALPSLYEGFGLPVLEAMACGAPVVCSNTTSLPEVAGDAALLVTPTDVEALAGAIRRLLADQGLRQDLAQRGLARARQFAWEETAKHMVRVYRAVLGQ